MHETGKDFLIVVGGLIGVGALCCLLLPEKPVSDILVIGLCAFGGCLCIPVFNRIFGRGFLPIVLAVFLGIGLLRRASGSLVDTMLVAAGLGFLKFALYMFNESYPGVTDKITRIIKNFCH